MVYIIEFFVFAFLGWIIDTLYSFTVQKRKHVSGYFHGIPLCPIYGFGGILLVNAFALMSEMPFWIVVPVTTILIVLLEYVGGWLAEFFLEEKLWDYSKESWNVNGFVSAWHSFLWLVTVTVMYALIDGRAGIYIGLLDSKISLNPNLEVLLIFLLIGLGFWLTVKTKKKRLAKLNNKRLVMLESMEEMFDFDRLLKLEEQKRKEILSNKNVESFLKKLEEWRTPTR